MQLAEVIVKELGPEIGDSKSKVLLDYREWKRSCRFSISKSGGFGDVGGLIGTNVGIESDR